MIRSIRRPYFLVGLALSFLLSIGAFIWNAPTVAAEPQTATPALSIAQGSQRTVLDNGLTVITKEIHTAPVVSVQIWYRVGSRNEAAGESGISHQLEHLMFKGTSDRPIQFGRFFNALGSQSNAFTYYDETAYFNTVESNKLDAILTLEADRMKNSLIEADQLASEKRVVISELQGYENSPGYRLRRTVMQAAFPTHPYGLPVGGTKADVQQFTVEQVKNYYQTYYSPDNAVLVIVGDFSTDAVLQTVRDRFAAIPKPANLNRPAAVPAPAAPATTATPASSQPIVLQEPGSATLLSAVYPLPNVNHPDVPAIDLMDTVLTGGRSSRLYQALVESGLVSSFGAYPEEPLEPGWYSISATAVPGQDVAQIDRVLEQTIADLRENGITETELNRAKTQLKTSVVLNNQDVTSQAMQLAYYQTIAGDYHYGDRYLAAVDQVTTADIQRVAQTYLDPAKRTVGYFEPTTVDGQPVAAGDSSRAVENFSPGEPVDPAEVARYLPPIPAEPNRALQPVPNQITLDNGLRVLLFPSPDVPMVNLSGWVNAGSSFDTNRKAGLASLTADNLMNGTETKDALAIATALEDEGASLGFSAAREGVNIDGFALPENLPTLVQTLADVLQHATFPADQLELSRQRALTDLKVEMDDPEQLSWRVFRQAIYPTNHPFHAFPTEASLKRIKRGDLRRFYQTHYRPDTTTLALVGNFNADQVRSLLEQAFSDWAAVGDAPARQLEPVALPPETQRVSRVIPGKAEAVTFMGYNGISRTDPRYYAAIVLNDIVGGNTLSSRLGSEIRDRQGLTYGINSFFQAGINPGPFTIVMQTAPEDANRAIDSTIALLQQLRSNGITAAELDTAKRSIISAYSVDLADPSYLTSVVLRNQVYGLSLEEIRDFPQRIEAVTSAQIQQVIEELIHPDNLVIVTTGPGEIREVSAQ